MAATPIQAGAGVEVYQLSRGLQLDDQENPNLFVRSSAKEIWQKIASKTRPLHGALVTGSPGIGKSRSLTYLLKLLLETRQTVIFEQEKYFYLQSARMVNTLFSQKQQQVVLGRKTSIRFDVT